LLTAARKRGRYGHLDATMILLAYRHGLRVSELVGLQWSQADFAHQRVHVNRLKNGLPAVHPLTGVELRALRQLRREDPHVAHVFMSERGAPFSPDGFRKMLERTAEQAGLAALKVHPHMLRHACGSQRAEVQLTREQAQALLALGQRLASKAGWWGDEDETPPGSVIDVSQDPNGAWTV
jgi:integrase